MRTGANGTGPVWCVGKDRNGYTLTYDHERVRVSGPIDTDVVQVYVRDPGSLRHLKSMKIRAVYKCSECRMLWIEYRELGIAREYIALPPPPTPLPVASEPESVAS